MFYENSHNGRGRRDSLNCLKKLCIYEERASKEDYHAVLISTMHKIARDMGLEIAGDEDIMIESFLGTSQFLEVQSLQDLEYLENEWGLPGPAHILMTSDIDLLYSKLNKLCSEGKIFSFFFLKTGDSVKNLAKSLEAIPVLWLAIKKRFKPLSESYTLIPSMLQL